MPRTASRILSSLLWTSLSLSAASCGVEDAGTGALEWRISGEDAAETGFPVSDEGEEIAFADGWTLQFTKYLVSVGNLSAGSSDGTSARVSSDSWVVDLHKGDRAITTFSGMAARRWDRISFELTAPTTATVGLDVDASDVQKMRDNAFNYWVEGVATKAGTTVTFAWGWQNPTRNLDCTNGDDDKAGIVVEPGATARAELTLHLEHAFWDALGSETAQLRFDAIAAKADAQGVVDFESLRTQPLLPTGADGQPIKDAAGLPVTYSAGATPLWDGQSNLRSFILTSAASQAHLNGEGLCRIEPKR